MIGVAAIIVAALTLAGALSILRVRGYRKWFHLASHRRDCLKLRDDCNAIPIILGPDGFDLPTDLDATGQTVLLCFTVAASFLGRLRSPYVALGDQQSGYRQYFERGAAGQRYLNLTPIFQQGTSEPPRRVSLYGSSIGWATEASLLIFPAPLVGKSDVLVLAPHPDDAEIAAFGMYSSHRSWVVTITAGERGTGNLPADMTVTARSERAASLRVSESLSIPRLAGVQPQQCANLVLPDGVLRLMAREPLRPFRLACEPILPRAELRSKNPIPELQVGSADCTWIGLVAEIRLVLSLSRPQIVICPHPLMDKHSDHVYTTVALAQAMRDLEGPHPTIFLYVVHADGVPAYPLGPTESLVGVPPGCGNDWLCDAVYSHMLEPALQRAKYLAVAATHATRTYREADRQLRNSLKPFTARLLARIAGLQADPTSFLRRAPRPNEMYFVVAGDALAALIAQAPGLCTTSS
jgi:LmbE family N-acetylglucosaminyl deacetylase